MPHVTVDPHGDLTINVVTYEKYGVVQSAPQHAQGSRQSISATSFLVNRSVLANCPTALANNVSNVFKNMLYGAFREARQDVITLEGDNEAVMAVFLRVTHNIDVCTQHKIKNLCQVFRVPSQ